LTFYLSSARARSSFDPEKASARTGRIVGTTEVEIRTIDSLLDERDIPVPDHIKLDVEGLGPEVLQGSVETLREHHPSIYWEPHGTGIDGSDPGSVEEFLRGMDYEITKLDYPVIAE
jgi:FkbM family methyltransferase